MHYQSKFANFDMFMLGRLLLKQHCRFWIQVIVFIESGRLSDGTHQAMQQTYIDVCHYDSKQSVGKMCKEDTVWSADSCLHILQR